MKTESGRSRSSKPKLEVLSEQPTGLGATYGYSGKMMGLTLTSANRLLIMPSYGMRLLVEPLLPSPSKVHGRVPGPEID